MKIILLFILHLLVVSTNYGCMKRKTVVLMHAQMTNLNGWLLDKTREESFKTVQNLPTNT